MLSEAEIRTILGALHPAGNESRKSFRDALVVLALFHFALRRTELAHLKWADIHALPCPHFRIRQKGGTEKYLPIPARYGALLREFRARYGAASRFIFHPLKNNRTKILDKPLSPNTILSITQSVVRGIFPERTISPHSFRSSFVCLARKYGLDDKQIMNATGQKSAAMVNYYDVRDRLEANAVNFFGEWLEESEKCHGYGDLC